MRKIIAEVAMSLDGFIEGPRGDLDWLAFEQESAYANAFLSRFDTIFYGRAAYEKFGIPREDQVLVSEGRREFNELLNGMRKYVFTRTRKHVDGNGMVISRNIEHEVKRIRDEHGKDIWLCGGSDMLRSFERLDLVDEYMLAVHPVALRSGKTFFGGEGPRLNLELISVDILRSGVVMLHYRPANRSKKQKAV